MGVESPWCSREGSFVPGTGIGSPQAARGGDEVAGAKLLAAWAEPWVGGRESYRARRVQDEERIKGRTNLLIPHVLLRLPCGIHSTQSFASTGQCGRWFDVSPPRLSSGIDSFFGAQDDQRSPLAGLGAPATATLVREAKGGRPRSPG